MLPNPFDDRPDHAKFKLSAIYAALIAANIASWVWAWTAFADRPTLLATAFLAYTFGLRHAFDADHIAAIDNIVRKLMQEGRSPYSAGLFFSLGHSTIVVVASIVIAATAAETQIRFDIFHGAGGGIGTAVSALFLLAIGLANLFIFRSSWVAFLRARRAGKLMIENIDLLLANCGLLTRMFRPVFRLVARSWHMYPIGFLFGLSFDTATEIGLLGISAAQTAQGMSVWTILVFPALFTAGMSLMDTTDSALMTGAYGWAFVKPLRKLWYNLTITAASIAVAIFIGGVEVLGLVGNRLGFQGRFWSLIGDINASSAKLGFAVLGVFILSWVVSALICLAKRYDRFQTT